MSHRQMSVRSPWRARARGAGVLALVAGLSLPLLHASGGASGTVDDVVSLARAQVGEAYVWGGTGPDTWDCSGLTGFVWREGGGVTGMPRTSAQQQRWTVPIPKEQLQPGDLAFFGDPVTHVALYIGGGKVVDASSAKTGVLERALWNAKDARYGRVPRPGMPPVTPWTPPSPAPSASATPSATPTPSGSAAPSTSPPASLAPLVKPVVTRAPASTPRPTASAAAGTAAGTAPGTAARPGVSPTTARPTTPTRPVTFAGPTTTATPRATATSKATAAPTARAARPGTTTAAKPATTAAPKAGATFAPRPGASVAPAPRPAAPTARPAAAPSARPTTSPAPRPAPRPGPAVVRPLADLPAKQLKPSSAVALKAVAAAKAVAGSTSGTDVSLVRAAWTRAGGHALPADRRALVAKAVQVPRPWVRVGDLVSYGTPASQVYLYAGSGYMVGFSPEHGKVVVRRVHTGDVRFLRLPV